jgi:hypothetical protein
MPTWTPSKPTWRKKRQPNPPPKEQAEAENRRSASAELSTRQPKTQCEPTEKKKEE